MNKIFILILLSLSINITGCNRSPSVHFDPPEADNYSGPRSWNPKNFPLEIYVPSELNDKQVAILNSERTWNDAFGTTVIKFIFNTSTNKNTQWTGTYDSLSDGFFGIFKINSWNYPGIDQDVLAFTSSNARNGRIINADILFNFSNSNYIFGDVTNLNENNNIDFESVLTHELGHFLGFSHVETQIDPNSIMNPTIRKGQTKRVLSNSDLYKIEEIYPR